MNACTYIVVWDKKIRDREVPFFFFQYADPEETGVADYHALNHLPISMFTLPWKSSRKICFVMVIRTFPNLKILKTTPA